MDVPDAGAAVGRRGQSQGEDKRGTASSFASPSFLSLFRTQTQTPHYHSPSTVYIHALRTPHTDTYSKMADVVATPQVEKCPASAPFFGFMGVTAAIVFASTCEGQGEGGEKEGGKKEGGSEEWACRKRKKK